MTKRTTRMGLNCPSRWIRSIAWNSTAGFHHGSMMYTALATVRLSATPPALREMRNTRHCGSSQKLVMNFSRCSNVMRPSSFTHLIPASFKRCSTMSSIETNCENTMPLALGSCSASSSSSSIRPSILVLLRKSEVFPILARIPGVFRRLEAICTPSAGSPERSTDSGFSHAGHFTVESGAVSMYSCTHSRQKECLQTLTTRFSAGSEQMQQMPSSLILPSCVAR
mmetsp:Transcript_43714/g.103894  ORF Transcript_43714/g.103894 Transcript_43714/m.103894 type:complete len:225 (-) Transcript_43714:918-1592(-)